MKKLAVSLALVFLPISGFALSQEYVKCVNAKDHVTLNMCESKEYDRQSQEMDKIYKQVLKTNPSVSKSQKKWLRQLEKNCPESGGTTFAFEMQAKCFAQKIEERIIELEDYATSSQCKMPKNDENSEVEEGGLRLEQIEDYVSNFSVKGIKKRVYFYSVPLDNCKTDRFVVSNDSVNSTELFGEYINANYVNSKTGVTVKGWIKRDELKQSGNNTASNNVKKVLGGIGSGNPNGNKLYSITCSNNKIYAVQNYAVDGGWSLADDNMDTIEIDALSIKELAEPFCKSKNK